MEIEKVNENDSKEIALLEERLLYGNHGNNNGFLVSAFSEENYRKFVSIYEYFFKVTDNGKIIGILMAYESTRITPEDKNNTLIKHTVKTDFILIKQIFTSPEYFNKGIASMLYNHLFSIVGPNKPIIAVTVMEPMNIASCQFHKRKEFVEFLSFVPDADADNVVRKRSAWIRPPKNSKDIHEIVKVYNVPDDSARLSRTMFSRIKDYISLYRHEDNLNWTKTGMQSTILFALIAVVAYFFDKEIPKDSILFIAILGFWGTIINALFFFKIRSGVNYMNVYKEKIKEYDKIISFYHPKANLIFTENDFISGKSITSRLLCIVSLLGLVFWIILIIFLILKALDVFKTFPI